MQRLAGSVYDERAFGHEASYALDGTMRTRQRIVWAWLPVALYMALIWLLSSRPLGVSVSFLPFKDKGAHTIEYAILATLAARALYRTWPDRGLLRALVAAFFLTVGWGFLDELHQAFVPSRNADSADLAADSVGAVLGVCIYGAFRRIRRDRARSQG